jgi:putative DNA primase/helicase
MSEPAESEPADSPPDNVVELPTTQIAGPSFFTDLSYSGELCKTAAGRLIHVHGRGWLGWDGKRWRENQKQAERASKKLAAEVLLAAIRSGDDTSAKKAVGRCAEPKIRAALKLAESDLRMAIGADLLDADPHLLNTTGGVVDLRDASLHPHDPALLMTKLAGADYDPQWQSERWEQFLADACGDDAELIGWLQRLAGYAATGHASEETVAFLHGPGATGKTTWTEAIRAALGGYAASVEFASLLGGRNDGSSASPDVARLEGVRAAFASEVNTGQRFNTQRLKSLTGGERIVARRLYREPVEFTPQFTLILAANDRPEIPASDDAAWRRMRAIPFAVVVPEPQRDPSLKAALINDPEERAGVLAWIVQGAVQWYQHGLGTCAAIERATASYKLANDSVATWLATCELTTEASSNASELRASYERWCAEHAAEPVTPQPFRVALESHGLTRKRTERGYVWQGIHAPNAPNAPAPHESRTRAPMGESSDRGAFGASGTGEPQETA